MGAIDSFIEFFNVVGESLGISPVVVAFVLGGMLVYVVTSIVGRITFRMRVWQQAIDAAQQPQKAFTTQTPHQVVQASQAAKRKLGGCQLMITLSVFGAAVVGLLSWLHLWDDVWGWVSQGLQGLFTR